MKKVLSLALSGLLVFSLNSSVVKASETTNSEILEVEDDTLDTAVETTETNLETEEDVAETNLETEEYVSELENKDVTINLVIEFIPEDAEVYKESIQDALDENMESLVNEMMKTQNSSKMDLLDNLVNEIENLDIESLFKEEGNSTMLKIPLTDMNVSIDEAELNLSSDGKVESGEFEANEEVAETICTQDTVSIVLDDMADLAVDAEIEKNESNIEINYKFTYEDFSEGVEEMANNMSEGTAQKITNVYPAKVKVGSYVGAGAGRTKVYFNTNIVGCNKHDKNLKSITTKQFAAGNSDCAKSVKLGLIALADSSGFLKAYYANSINCVIEGMTSITGENVNNIYCNGKRKSGNHVNCSWFNGIGHSERFHYHKYS